MSVEFCDRDHLARKPRIFTIQPLKKKFLTPSLDKNIKDTLVHSTFINLDLIKRQKPHNNLNRITLI